MRYREYTPHPALRPFVDILWILEGVDDSGGGNVETVIPDEAVEIILHYGDPFDAADGYGESCTGRRATVVGQITKPIRLLPGRHVGLIGVRFRPGGASTFVRAPLNRLVDTVWSLDDFWGGDASEILHLVAGANGDAERFALVEHALLRRLAGPRETMNSVDAAVRMILRCGGNLRIDEICAQVDIGGRQLERQFNERVGVSPKFLSRIVRFRRVLECVDRGGPIDWARFAVACGYYDQSHLIRDFRRFAGHTPLAVSNHAEAIGRCLTHLPSEPIG